MRKQTLRNILGLRPRISDFAWLSLALLLLPCCVTAQTANWNTGSGNWSNANNWDCAGSGVPSHCVPSAGFTVTDISGDITLDVNASVATISGSTGTLTMSGKTLTATDPLGIQLTGGIVTATGGSVINGFLLSQILDLQDSTVNGNVQAFNGTIGNSSLGSLTIDNQLTASNSSIGANSNLTLAQPSSISNSTIGGQFNINFGASLTVDNHSTVNATQNLLTSGSLNILGGSTWNAGTQPFAVGLQGASSVDVSGAGSVLNLTSTALELGQIADATVTVEHLGSIVATGASGNFLIGLGIVFPTASTMLVNSGGTASANEITVSGGLTGGTGLLSISGLSSSVTSSGQFLIENGGVVNVANQGSLTPNSFRIQTGTLTADSNATLNLGSGSFVLIGSGGTGTLNLLGGATANATGELVLGTSGTSSGTLNLAGSGSKWTNGNDVRIGESGSGSLNVSAGGVMVSAANAGGLSAVLGNQVGGVGVATVQGGDWQANGAILIGNNGSGSLQLSQAGTVESGTAIIGSNAGSSGSASVSGVGSKWTISGNLTVGSFGSGSLGISGAGVVTNTNATIGEKQGSSGVVTVVGVGSSWQNSGLLAVGGDGAASLTIDAGNVTAGGASMGSNFAPVNVDVTNHGALNVLGDVSIGGAGTTNLTIEKGGTFDSGTNATIGGAGGDTTVMVTGAGSAWTLHGTGNMVVSDKGSLMVMDSGTVTSSFITVATGGLLNGQGGTIIGSLINAGGTITPGDATGIMSLMGNYTQSSGTLLLEIDGLNSNQFDQLLISGTADFTGGSIELVFGNGFVPTAGESFNMLDAALGLNLSNVNFQVLGLPSGLDFSQTIGANGITFDFGSNGGSTGTPEPATLFLLGSGVIALAAYSKRRRAL